MRHIIILLITLGLTATAWSVTAITYQGQLQDNGQPFDGQVDMTFELFDDPDPAVGNSIAGPIHINDVDVVDGLFQVNLPFGNVYNGERFLQVTVGSQDLLPRQRIAQTPVAMFALNVKDGVSGIWEKSGDEISYSANNQEIQFRPNTDPNLGPQIVFGHSSNRAQGSRSTVSGGGSATAPNWADASGATIGGGNGNIVDQGFGTIAGGTGNEVTGVSGFAGGGTANKAEGTESVITGGMANQTFNDHAFIGGGRFNIAYGEFSTIGGGGTTDPSDVSTRNAIFDDYGTIGGGGDNKAGTDDGDTTSARFATIGGGVGNAASARNSTISGGASNNASERGATISGGESNIASGSFSSVIGGFNNRAQGAYATASGWNSKAIGNFTFAAGHGAKASHIGSFVWSDISSVELESTGENQFLVEATGGAEFQTGSIGLKAFSNSGSTTGAAVQAESTHSSGIALVGRNESDDTTLALNNTGTGPLIKAFTGGTLLLQLDNNGDMTIDGNLTENSDRNTKEAIRPVNNQQVLQRLIDLDISTWRYKNSPEGVRHIGPMAQDFHALFGFGKSETSITGMDVRGVALAAIQGLHQRHQVMQSRIEHLEEENAELRALARRNAELEDRLAALESVLLDHRKVTATGQ